ncbi:HlyD family efflux transporter periplasmic adaptor subunit [Aquimarina gracilis]|uniref:HlyD family efflux transporter periplasmic adaptor subunit n=1 Tax=Aquimarina gracilis TaxID=874422 RepID=A0ABU6A0A6_9FLAO|nr:HlyD family efflux transporter periplasmic adaptor subunit [Aquimarina gracilis]MEB3347549.1 HlyD family efflux transporter periplasmic adaptor subunit [Aquimarina gracilis]
MSVKNENTLQDFELRSEEVQEILSTPPSWMARWGITVVFFILLLIVGASCIVEYPDVVTSNITITTEVPVEKIEAKSSGRIVHLLVRDQQEVKHGQILAVIENTADFKDFLMLKNIVDTLELNYQNFEFPIEKTEHLSLGELEQDYALFEKSYTDFILNKNLKPFSIETLSGQQTLSELNGRIKVLKTQRDLEKKELEVREKDLERTKSLYKKGVISKVEFENKELEYLQARRNYENTKINMSQIQESKNNTKRGIQGSNINKIQNDTKYLKEVISSYKQLKRSIKQWEQAYLLVASIDGKVSFQKFWGKNQFVNEGDDVLTILPSKSTLVGKITTSAINTGKIKSDQNVLIKLDGYPYQEFGMIKGEVISMSLSPDNEGNYYIEVDLPKDLQTTYGKELAFNREMRGTAGIVTEDLKVIERVFYQFRNIFKYN